MRELTGKHVLMITGGAFAVIFAVNMLMAFKAVSTFPGLEVRSSYVASQTFDRDRNAQEALNWRVSPEHDGQVLAITIRDGQGNPAPVQDLQVTVGRPTHMREDQDLTFTYHNGYFSAPLELAPGAWLLHLRATAPDGTQFRQRIEHRIPERGA